MPLTNKLVSNVCILFALHFHLSRLLKKSWGLCIYSDAHFLLDAVFKCFHIGWKGGRTEVLATTAHAPVGSLWQYGDTAIYVCSLKL